MHSWFNVRNIHEYYKFAYHTQVCRAYLFFITFVEKEGTSVATLGKVFKYNLMVGNPSKNLGTKGMQNV